MADENNEAAAGQDQQAERSFGMQSVYLRDASFESPHAPAIFEGDWRPEMSVNIGTRARGIGDDRYEVILTVSVEAKQGDKTGFLVELQQAGTFVLKGFGDQEKTQILAILCPQNLFPFAREAIANLTSKGGFAPLLLQPINFERLYQQQLQQQNAATQGEA